MIELVHRLRAQGTAILIITHNMRQVFEVADRIAVLHVGRLNAMFQTVGDGTEDRGQGDDGQARRRRGGIADGVRMPVVTATGTRSGSNIDDGGLTQVAPEAATPGRAAGWRIGDRTSRGRVHALHVEEHRDACHREPHPHRHLLPDPVRALPDAGQPDQPVGADHARGHHRHGPSRGPAAGRDRPFDGLHGRYHRGHPRRAHGQWRSALVDRCPADAALRRRPRRLPGRTGSRSWASRRSSSRWRA